MRTSLIVMSWKKYISEFRAYWHQAKAEAKAKRSKSHQNRSNKRRQTSKKSFAFSFAWSERAFIALFLYYWLKSQGLLMNRSKIWAFCIGMYVISGNPTKNSTFMFIYCNLWYIQDATLNCKPWWYFAHAHLKLALGKYWSERIKQILSSSESWRVLQAVHALRLLCRNWLKIILLVLVFFIYFGNRINVSRYNSGF